MAVSTSGVSTTNYTGYDPLGRVVASNEKVGATSYGFTYGWNLAGDLMQETYPSTRLVGFGWDYARQPTWVGGNYQSQAATYLGFINFSGFQETYRSFASVGRVRFVYLGFR